MALFPCSLHQRNRGGIHHALSHTPLAWGCIVGVSRCCSPGCSRQQEPVPLPSVPHAHEKVAPAPVPRQKKLPWTANLRPPRSGRPPVWTGFPWPRNSERRDVQSTRPDRCPSDAAAGTKATVTNLETGQSVQVKINDRGPYVPGRHLDSPQAAAKQIGLTRKASRRSRSRQAPRQATQ